jgi:hypothetical protein
MGNGSKIMVVEGRRDASGENARFKFTDNQGNSILDLTIDYAEAKLKFGNGYVVSLNIQGVS